MTSEGDRMDVTPDDIVWLSTARAAARLGVTPRTLYRFVDHGEVNAYRFGRVLRFRLDELDQFIERCRIVPGSLGHLYGETGGDTDGDQSREAE